MICPGCNTNSPKPHGKFGRAQIQRFRCRSCGRTFSERSYKLLRDFNVPDEKVVQILSGLLEGLSVRSVERLTGVHRDTIIRIMLDAGNRCQDLLDAQIRNIPVSQVQVDELWGYCFKKEKHKTREEFYKPEIGDAYTYLGLESRTKLILCFVLGKRNFRSALRLVEALKRATSGVFQLTTDGYKAYRDCVHLVFGDSIHFAQLVKLYSSDESTHERYSPGKVVEAIPMRVTGEPCPENISTSHVERLNLTMRMQMRRLTRLTSGFSKKWENLEAALALMVAHYNFCRVHLSLKTTPAVKANLTDHVWTIQEFLSVNFQGNKAVA